MTGGCEALIVHLDQNVLNKYIQVGLLKRRSKERGGRKAARAFLHALLPRAANLQLINYVGLQKTVNKGFYSFKAKDTGMWMAAMWQNSSPLCVLGAGGCK